MTKSSSKSGCDFTDAGGGRHYPTAIGDYATAMLADRNDPTYPLNRAAAHLKPGKYVSTGTQGKTDHLLILGRFCVANRNEDAKRDCTTAIWLNATNVKALLWRGQARVRTENLLEAQNGISKIAQMTYPF